MISEINVKTKYVSESIFLTPTEQTPQAISRFEYDDLLEKVRYYIELTDAMSTVRLLLSPGTHPKRYGAYRRLAIMAGEAESVLRELI